MKRYKIVLYDSENDARAVRSVRWTFRRALNRCSALNSRMDYTNPSNWGLCFMVEV